MRAQVPADDGARIRELHSYGVLDTPPDEVLDELTYLASRICGCPIALISLVDGDRQWFKSKVGVETVEAPRDVAFCAHSILQPSELCVIADTTADPRSADNPLVTPKRGIRFYAGAPLVTPTGHALGTICVMDRKPRELSDDQKRGLTALSRLVMTQLELGRPKSEPAPVAAPASDLEALERKVAELQEAAEDRRRFQEELLERQRQLEERAEVMARESKMDPLTAIANQRGFIERLDQEFSRARRYEMPLSLVFLDIDDFKSYNDEFGDIAGDSVLEQIATLLHDQTRVSDFIARYEGGQFAIILTNTDAAGAMVMAERVRSAVEAATWLGRAVAVSAGIATMSTDTANSAQFIEDANAAMNEAKENGRNRVHAA